IGGPPAFSFKIKTHDGLINLICTALQDDISNIEDKNKDKINFILCGGKDSLNLLLLKWKNPVVVLSADPNYELVKTFIKRNDLKFDVIKLVDYNDKTFIKREIAEAFCRVDLQQWRWGIHLSKIARECNYQGIFWKGQVADLFFTPYWRTYTSRHSKLYNLFRKGYGKLSEKGFSSLLDPVFKNYAIEDMRKSLWERAAVLQGDHQGFLRSISNCLFLSAYHGPQMTNVWKNMDFSLLCTYDIRKQIGRSLSGKEIFYPEENPSPPASEFKKNLNYTRILINSLTEYGIHIETT
ncbi:MAG: hypothetical protein ACLFSE_14290, partial [Spirochaetia bacterium]